MDKKAIIYCFSGTGNTEKVSKEYKKIFDENGIETLLYSIGDNFDNMPSPKDYDYVGIAYPIHGFNAPYPIFDLIKLFPNFYNEKKKIFIIKTSGEPLTINNISSEPIMARLKHKGYILTNEYHYIMPYNIIFRHTDEFAARMWKTAKALCVIEANEILYGKENFLKKFPFGRLIAFLFRIEHPAMKVNGNLFKVKNICIHCNLCVNKCPVHNIYTNEKNDIKFKNKCVMCTSCAFRCPVDAINIGILNGWKVNGVYKFENPPLGIKTKNDNYCKKAYDRYFSNADKKIHNYADILADKNKSYYKNIENYIS